MQVKLINKLLSLEDRDEWSACLNKLPESFQDVYYTPDYYEIYEKNGDGKAWCFVYDDGNNLAMYPFLLNRINELGYDLDKSYYDIQGAYGYNGVLSTSNDLHFVKKFYKEFKKYCEDNKIIVEFTRFFSSIENHKFSLNFLDVVYNRKTVYLDLRQKYDAIYRNYSRSLKGNLRQALKNNLVIKIYKNEFPYSKVFVNIYKDTMDRKHAQQYLYFNDDYFENMFKTLPVFQFVVFNDELPIASSICLISTNNINIHFEASRKQYLYLRPNDILIDTIVRWGIGNGYQNICLGGGLTSDDKDTLLRFKRKFSKTTSDFYIGKKIHNSEIYNEVIRQWEVKNPCNKEKSKNILLRYRSL